MKMLKIAFLALATSVTAPALAQTVDVPVVPVQHAQQDVEAVRLLLSGYHDLAPRASFEAIPNGPRIVNEFARGPHSVVRDRALAALGRYWPSADVYLLYANVIAASDTSIGTRHRVVLMAAEAFGDRAIPVLEPLLFADDVQLQITTVQAIGSIGTDAARAAVSRLEGQTSNPMLLEAIESAVRYVR